jgi:hypothetical protein
LVDRVARVSRRFYVVTSERRLQHAR